jgi:hypothetical protein
MIIIFLIMLLLAATMMRIRSNRNKEREAYNSFFGSEGIRALQQAGFDSTDTMVFGSREGFVTGIYFRFRSKPEYFTFINCKVPQGVSSMMTFNKKYKHEDIAIDTRAGFCQEVKWPLTETMINTSISRLIAITRQEGFDVLT